MYGGRGVRFSAENDEDALTPGVDFEGIVQTLMFANGKRDMKRNPSRRFFVDDHTQMDFFKAQLERLFQTTPFQQLSDYADLLHSLKMLHSRIQTLELEYL